MLNPIKLIKINLFKAEIKSPFHNKMQEQWQL